MYGSGKGYLVWMKVLPARLPNYFKRRITQDIDDRGGNIKQPSVLGEIYTEYRYKPLLTRNPIRESSYRGLR